MQGQQMAKTNQQMDMSSNVKTAIPKTQFSAILPNSQQQIRPASSVSTQTGQTQSHLHQANLQSQKSGTKVILFLVWFKALFWLT